MRFDKRGRMGAKHLRDKYKIFIREISIGDFSKSMFY